MLSSPEKQGNKVKKMVESYVTSPVIKSFLAGSLSGTCSTVIFQPLDLIKTRIQSPVALGRRSSGMMSVFVNVMRNEKILGLWKGVTPSLSRTVPGIGFYFGSLHWLRSNLGSVDPSPRESFCMGAAARCVAGAAVLPFTVIKTRYESGFFGYTGMKHAFVSIYEREGARGLCSGLTATLLRDAPFSGIYLVFYTQAKKIVSQREGWDSSNPFVVLGCGIISGGLAASLTQPFDVIKTHMQLYPDKFSSIRKATVHIYQKDGGSGFLRGLLPRTMRRSLMAAFAWTFYEEWIKRLGLK